MTDQATVTPAAGEAVVTPATTPAPTPTPDPAITDPASSPAATPESSAPDAASTGEDDKGKKPNRIDAKERVQQAVRRQRLAERERDAALRRIAELEKPIRPQNFDQLDFEQRDQLRVREAVRAETAESARAEASVKEAERQEAYIEARNARNEAFGERLMEADKANPGLYERFASVPVTEDMAQFIAESDLSVEIANYLSMPANRREAEYLSRLTDPQGRPTREDLREADRILSRIEQRLSKAPQTRKATTAPNPGTTLAGGNPAPAGKDPGTMSDAEYSAWYRQRAKAAQR